MKLDFYLIKNLDKKIIACRLAQKAFLHGYQAFIYVTDEKIAKEMDELLWSFQQNSFIPHAMVGRYKINPPPIEIGYKKKPEHHQDILINLTEDIPNFVTAFNRVIEILAITEKQEKYEKYQSLTSNFSEHYI